MKVFSRVSETITRPLSGLRQGMDRNARRTVNGLRLAAGLDRPRTGCTPHLIIWRQDRATMRRYRAGIDGDRPPVLLVPSLINKSRIWDLRPGDSFVEGLLAHGYDVFLIDWGTPDARDAANTTSTYVDGYLPSAYATATEHAGQPPAVLGHCFGGVITTLWAASTASQPPALIAPQDAAGDQLSGHGRGVHALAAEPARHPQAFAQLANLRHAVHGLAGGAAERIGDLDIAEIGEDRADPALNGAGEALRTCRPGRLRAFPHQAVTIDNTEMVDAVGIDHVGFGSDLLGVPSRAFQSYADLPALAAEMLRHGFRRDEVLKILGHNYARVFAIAVT